MKTSQLTIKYENKTQYHVMFLHSFKKWVGQAVERFDQLSGANKQH